MISEDPKQFAKHSFRRGGAALAYKAGVQTDLIKTQGDWKSEAYQKSIEVSLSDKLKLAKLMNDFISA